MVPYLQEEEGVKEEKVLAPLFLREQLIHRHEIRVMAIFQLAIGSKSKTWLREGGPPLTHNTITISLI